MSVDPLLPSQVESLLSSLSLYPYPNSSSPSPLSTSLLLSLFPPTFTVNKFKKAHMENRLKLKYLSDSHKIKGFLNEINMVNGNNEGNVGERLLAMACHIIDFTSNPSSSSTSSSSSSSSAPPANPNPNYNVNTKTTTTRKETEIENGHIPHNDSSSPISSSTTHRTNINTNTNTTHTTHSTQQTHSHAAAAAASPPFKSLVPSPSSSTALSVSTSHISSSPSPSFFSPTELSIPELSFSSSITLRFSLSSPSMSFHRFLHCEMPSLEIAFSPAAITSLRVVKVKSQEKHYNDEDYDNDDDDDDASYHGPLRYSHTFILLTPHGDALMARGNLHSHSNTVIFGRPPKGKILKNSPFLWSAVAVPGSTAAASSMGTVKVIDRIILKSSLGTYLTLNVEENHQNHNNRMIPHGRNPFPPSFSHDNVTASLTLESVITDHCYIDLVRSDIPPIPHWYFSHSPHVPYPTNTPSAYLVATSTIVFPTLSPTSSPPTSSQSSSSPLPFDSVGTDVSGLGSSGHFSSLHSELQEQLLIEDLLFTLMGFEGKYVFISASANSSSSTSSSSSSSTPLPIIPPPFVLHPLQYNFSAQLISNPSFQELLLKILPLCSSYLFLQHFCEYHSLHVFGRCFHSFVSVIKSLLKEYLVLIIQMETEWKSRNLTLLRLYYYLFPSIKIMSKLSELCGKLSASHVRGGALINSLHEMIETEGDVEIKKLYVLLCTNTSGPYFNTLYEWITRGDIDDKYNEFPIEIQRTNRNLISSFGSSLSSSSSIATAAHRSSLFDSYWNDQYVHHSHQSLAFLSTDYHHKILSIGKYLNIIKECNKEIPFMNIPNRITYKDGHEGITYYHHIIDVCYTVSSSYLLQLLLSDFQLYQRFRQIKKLFLFESGDIMMNFLDIAQEELLRPMGEVNGGKLQSLLELTLKTSRMATQTTTSSSSSITSHNSMRQSRSSRPNRRKAGADDWMEDIFCSIQPTTLMQKLEAIHKANEEQRREREEETNRDGNGGGEEKEEKYGNREEYTSTPSRPTMSSIASPILPLTSSPLFKPSAIEYGSMQSTSVSPLALSPSLPIVRGLDVFTLNINVEWPLSLILSRKMISKYQLLFRLFFSLKCIERSLISSWQRQCSLFKFIRSDFKYSAGVSSAFQPLPPTTPRSLSLHHHDKFIKDINASIFSLRSRMTHFIQNFLHYCLIEVVEYNWEIFMGDMAKCISTIHSATATNNQQNHQYHQNLYGGSSPSFSSSSSSSSSSLPPVGTLDDVLSLHSHFVDSCLRQTLIPNSTLMSVIEKILIVCKEFCDAIDRWMESEGGEEEEGEEQWRKEKEREDEEREKNEESGEKKKKNVGGIGLKIHPSLTSPTKTPLSSSSSSHYSDYYHLVSLFTTAFDSHLRQFIEYLRVKSHTQYDHHLAALLNRLDYNEFYQKKFSTEQ